VKSGYGYDRSEWQHTLRIAFIEWVLDNFHLHSTSSKFNWTYHNCSMLSINLNTYELCQGSYKCNICVQDRITKRLSKKKELSLTIILSGLLCNTCTIVHVSDGACMIYEVTYVQLGLNIQYILHRRSIHPWCNIWNGHTNTHKKIMRRYLATIIQDINAD
jgi:hypothetical protein